MKARAFLAAISIAAAIPTAASEWIEVRTSHFTVVSNAGRGKAWTVADEFERIRAVFKTALSSEPAGPSSPLLIFAVEDEAAFRELLPGLGDLDAAGVFAETRDGERVVLRLDVTGDNPYQPLYHEYHHVVLREAAGRSVPSWVEEGLAEFWSQAVIRPAEVEIGNPHRGHLRFLRGGRMMPLEELLRVHGFRHDADMRAIRTLYAQSWALVHWILLGDGTGAGQGRMERYLERVAFGENPVDPFIEIFGPLAEVESALAEYLEQSLFPAMRIPRPPDITERFEVRSLSEGEAAVLRADFLIATDQFQGAREVLESGAEADPESSAGAERLGVLAYESGEYGDAAARFDDAIEANEATVLSYYYRALLSRDRGDRESAVSDLESAIELNPGFAPAYLELASLLARDPDSRDRVPELTAQALALAPNDVFGLVKLGRRFAELGLFDDARKVLERVRALPPVPGSKAIVSGLEAAIEREAAR